MFELMLVVLAVIGIYRVAESDGNNGLMWGAITLGVCVLSFAIPLPFLRIGLAAASVFAAMTFTKKTYY